MNGAGSVRRAVLLFSCIIIAGELLLLRADGEDVSARMLPRAYDQEGSMQAALLDVEKTARSMFSNEQSVRGLDQKSVEAELAEIAAAKAKLEAMKASIREKEAQRDVVTKFSPFTTLVKNKLTAFYNAIRSFIDNRFSDYEKRADAKVSGVESKMASLGAALERKQRKLDRRLAALAATGQSKIDTVEHKISTMENRLAGRVEEKLDQIDANVTALDVKLSATETLIKHEVDKRFRELERRVGLHGTEHSPKDKDSDVEKEQHAEAPKNNDSISQLIKQAVKKQFYLTEENNRRRSKRG